MAELSERLKKLTAALRPLHLALTKETQVSYERQHGAVQGPGELLQLLIRHPDFAWLHPLSELMAVADELLDPRREVPVAPEEAAVVRNQVERLLLQDETFSPRYRDILQQSPTAVMAHSAVRDALKGLAEAVR
ncbi:MAG TPA: hypothetical protein VF973_00400 [Myxococcales bacterium]